jgi:phosphotransferase system HPr (HPr) family protein
MTMHKVTLTVTHDVGLHARPASLFVRSASEFECDIQVRNHTQQSDWIDAKSILSVLTLGVERGHQIDLQAQGPDAEQAIKALRELVSSDFGDKS